MSASNLSGKPEASVTVLAERTPLYLPDLSFFKDDGLTYAVDGAAPNWIVVEPAGRALLEAIMQGAGTVTFGALVARYAAERQVEAGKAWVHVHDFLRALDRAGILSDQAFGRAPYPGRLALVAPRGLQELWLQINNACNLACTHCLVSSGPGKEPGLPLERLLGVVDRAVELGLERLYITGGEPFVRKDVFALLRHATEERGLEAIVLTNATVFQGSIGRALDGLDRSRVRFQVSIDGARAVSNDAIRGPGTFAKALEGARLLSDLGYEVSVTTVTTRGNLAELPEIPRIVKDVGARSHHLMWTHKRGRAAVSLNGLFPEVPELVSAVQATADAADGAGVALDNLESVKRRVNGVPGVKYDFGNGGWDSLCVNFDGKVYPSGALANDHALLCGDAARDDLARILETSPVVRRLREATVARKPSVQHDPFRFFTGGGDWEHAWCFSGGDPLAPDPCCPTRYDAGAVAHIPQDVLDRFYGCGSPMTSANVKPGESVVDLGSGAGIDVFIAAKLVGPTGKAVGVDMTDAMLTVANENRPQVAAALGYDVVEFRKGYLEAIPVASKTVDVITSNCVVNLSPDKPRVFEEMWRILKDHGRIVISDIVSEREVPPHLKVNPRLWGECLVGALTQEQFLALLERAGFYGLSVLKKTYWKDVEGYPFFSITLRGFKYEKTVGCVFKGHRAVYLGPGKAFVDEEGHLFPRNEPYEVCTDTVAKLLTPPYQGMFAILEPDEERVGYACCGPEGACC